MADTTFLSYLKKESLLSVLGFVGMAFAGVGTLIAVFGIRDFVRMQRLHGDGVRTQGTVEDRRVRGTGDDRRYDHEYVFTDREGQQHRAIQTARYGDKGYMPGKNVEVMYDPRDPSTAMFVREFRRHWRWRWVAIFLPGGFAIVGWLLVLVMARGTWARWRLRRSGQTTAGL